MISPGDWGGGPKGPPTGLLGNPLRVVVSTRYQLLVGAGTPKDFQIVCTSCLLFHSYLLWLYYCACFVYWEAAPGGNKYLFTMLEFLEFVASLDLAKCFSGNCDSN